VDESDGLRLAHASDPRFGSIHHQGSALRHFARSAADMGCQHCLVSCSVQPRVLRGPGHLPGGWVHYRPVQDDYEPVGHVDLLDCGIIGPLFTLGCTV